MKTSIIVGMGCALWKTPGFRELNVRSKLGAFGIATAATTTVFYGLKRNVEFLRYLALAPGKTMKGIASECGTTAGADFIDTVVYKGCKRAFVAITGDEVISATTLECVDSVVNACCMVGVAKAVCGIWLFKSGGFSTDEFDEELRDIVGVR